MRLANRVDALPVRLPDDDPRIFMVEAKLLLRHELDVKRPRRFEPRRRERDSGAGSTLG